MTGKQVDKLAGDRGYRGIKQIGQTKILIQTFLKLTTRLLPKEKETAN